MVVAERARKTGHCPGRKGVGLIIRPIGSQIQHQVGGAAERHRVLLAKQLGHSGEAVFA